MLTRIEASLRGQCLDRLPGLDNHITAVDIMTEPEVRTEFHEIPFYLDIPQPQNPMFEKVTYLDIDLSGWANISSFELNP